MKKYKPKFRGQDFNMKIEFKDGRIDERRIFAMSKSKAIKEARRTFNGINGLKRIISINPGSKWYR